MTSPRQRTAIGLCFALCAVSAAAPASAQSYDCPEVVDQYVSVVPGTPSAFALAGRNLSRCEISIFQYPLGGDLVQTGPSELDWVFIPHDDFTGVTTFKFRVTPPDSCRSAFAIGKVTFAGGSTGRLTPPVEEGCGAGFLFPSMGAMLGLMPFVGWTRRRMRIHR